MVGAGARALAIIAALKGWREKGFSTMVVARDEIPIGAIAVADRLRPDVEAALQALRGLQIGTIEVLTGDHPDAASALARRLGIACRGGLLPDEKVAVVQELSTTEFDRRDGRRRTERRSGARHRRRRHRDRGEPEWPWRPRLPMWC